MSAAPVVEVLQKAVESTLACQVCDVLLTDVSQYLSPNWTQQELDTFLEQSCANVLAGKLETECDAIVLLYGEDIYNALSGKVAADQVCSAIGLCA